MGLILKLAKATFSFDTTGAIDLQYKDNCIEIIETPVTKTLPTCTVVKEAKPEPLPVVKSNSVTCTEDDVSPDKRTQAFQVLKDIHNTELILAIRKYLGTYLSDKQFDDIITTLHKYVATVPAKVYTKYNIPLRVSQLAYCAMFIMAGYSHADIRNFMQAKGYHALFITKDFFSTLKHGKSKSSFVIASALWPQYVHKNRSDINKQIYLDKYERVLEALLAGYSPYKIMAYSGVSHQVVYNIRNGTCWANELFDYSGPYPIKSASDCSDIEVRVCKDCGKVIPVKRIKAQPDAEYCVDCQRKYEKA